MVPIFTTTNGMKMKRILCFWIALSAMTLFATAQEDQAPRRDKAFLIEYYRQTFDNLRTAVEGLNAEQLRFQPKLGSWSIGQCLEHILLSELNLLGYAKFTISQAPNPERQSEIKLTDDGIIASLTDRSFRATATAELTPGDAGKYPDPDTPISELADQRKSLISYIESLSDDDMRSRITDSPFGPVDGYQTLLFIAAHTARHTLQIEEIKADPAFPKP